MGQQEVYEILKNKFLSGDQRYFTIKEIRFFVMNNPSDTNSLENVSRSLQRLAKWGMLEERNYKFRFNKKMSEQSSL